MSEEDLIGRFFRTPTAMYVFLSDEKDLLEKARKSDYEDIPEKRPNCPKGTIMKIISKVDDLSFLYYCESLDGKYADDFHRVHINPISPLEELSLV